MLRAASAFDSVRSLKSSTKGALWEHRQTDCDFIEVWRQLALAIMPLEFCAIHGDLETR